jgi:thiamine kinase-like enzyme
LNTQVLETLATIDGFRELDPQTVSIERLGGLTNLNYKIDCARGSYVLRLAGEGTGDYIDRRAEFNNASIADRAGVNTEIIHFDIDSGTMLCRYIENAVTMDIDGLRDQGALLRTAHAFRQLHECGQPFQGQFELFQQIDQYQKILLDLGADLPEEYAKVQLDAEQIRPALSKHSLPNKPCHCDPMVENCVDSGDKMYIIDFEYAGNNDPMWDLGDLFVEGAFSEAQEQDFLTAYFGHSPSEFDIGRMVMYKAMCDLLWTLWGVVQHANKNPVEDFWAYAVGRLERCRLLMASDSFPRHLEAVRRGPE